MVTIKLIKRQNFAQIFNMKLVFRTLRGEPFELTIENSMSVKSVKDLLKKKFQLIPNNITLINGTKILFDTSIIDPETFKYNDFIVIHEEKQSLREYTTKSSIVKTPFSLLRTNSTPASGNEQEAKSSSISFVPDRRNMGKNARSKKQNKNGIDEDYERSPQFQEILKSFIAMGFNKQDSIKNLRKFNYDIDIAINYSITGVMPSKEVEEEEEVKEVVYQEVPQPKPKPRVYDVSGLSRYRFGEFNGQVQQLSNEKKHGLLRFLTEHREMDVNDLVQIFISCDSDYTIATHCLADV